MPRISVEELNELQAQASPPILLDVRSRSTYERDGMKIPGSVRVFPDQATEWAANYREDDRLVVTYCT